MLAKDALKTEGAHAVRRSYPTSLVARRKTLRLGVTAFAFAALVGCGRIHFDRLHVDDAGTSATGGNATQSGGDAGQTDGTPSTGENATQTDGTPSMGENATQTDGGTAPTDASVGCQPANDPTCPEICSELCNATDDDCDGVIDGSTGATDCTITTPTCDRDAGQCVLAACDPGFGDCDNDPTNGCEVDLTDINNCNGCGNVCTQTNGTPTCKNLVCEPDVCDADWGDCDNDPTNGCETPLDTSSDCGACGHSCTFSLASGSCIGSPGARECDIVECIPVEFQNCDNDVTNGCEADTTIDSANCGICGNDCTVGPQVLGGSCSSGSCTYTCEANYGDCTSSVGCETDLLSPGSCGDCNTNCNALPAVAVVTCDPNGGSPVCGITSCTGSNADCNGIVSDGCETDTDTSLANCGACSGQLGNQPCTGLPNVTTSACDDGECGVVTCTGVYEDCDGDPSNGCEHDPNVDPPCCNASLDSDSDGTNDCDDQCPSDPAKIVPGVCGCLVAESSTDTDSDGAPDCIDACKTNPNVQGDCQPWRRRLTIQGSQVPSAQNGFAVLVRIESDSSLAFYADPSGRDIYFEDTAGNPLPFEREAYASGAGMLVAWVKMDLTGANQDFYMYYGDGDTTEKGTPGTIWDGDYEAVYHLANLNDSTSHARHCTNRGTTPYASGHIGAALDFNGDAELLGPRGVLPTTKSYWTVSYWGYAHPSNSSGDNEQWAISTQDFAQDGMTIGIETPPSTYDDGNMLTYVGGWRAYQNTVMPDAVWAHVDARVYMNSSGYVEFSLNGGAWERQNLNTTSIRHTSGSYISVGGEEAATDENWLGHLDEVRISSVLRSNDWLKAEYNNQMEGSTFLSVGAEEGL